MLVDKTYPFVQGSDEQQHRLGCVDNMEEDSSNEPEPRIEIMSKGLLTCSVAPGRHLLFLKPSFVGLARGSAVHAKTWPEQAGLILRVPVPGPRRPRTRVMPDSSVALAFGRVIGP